MGLAPLGVGPAPNLECDSRWIEEGVLMLPIHDDRVASFRHESAAGATDDDSLVIIPPAIMLVGLLRHGRRADLHRVVLSQGPTSFSLLHGHHRGFT